MRTINLVIAGFGRVGWAFGRLVADKRDSCRERYGLDLVPRAALKSDGGILCDDRLPLETLLAAPTGGLRESVLWKRGLRFADIVGNMDPGVLVECTPSDLRTGEPGLSHITAALENG